MPGANNLIKLMKYKGTVLFSIALGIGLVIPLFSTIYQSSLSFFLDLFLLMFLFSGIYTNGFYKKKTILILRKFYDPISIKIFKKLTRQLRQDFRLVTLSVKDFKSQHDSRASFSLTFLLYLFIPIGLIIGELLSITFGITPGSLTTGMLNALTMVFPYSLVWIAPFIPIVLVIISLNKRNLKVRDQKEYLKTLKRVHSIKNKISTIKVYQPILTTIITNDTYWRNLVKELITTCDFVIMDVSQMSANMEWERQQLISKENSIFISNNPNNFNPSQNNCFPYSFDTKSQRKMIKSLRRHMNEASRGI